MKEWTREERYRVLRNPEEIRDLYEQIRHSEYRQAYHVQPMTGLSSDPNGFALYNGVWHLFYQWCPWGAVHGLKYWYHVSSPDLLHWKNEGIGLAPDKEYDNKGTHSGSAISDGEDLYFFYTGNHRDEDWTRTPYTCVAKMGPDGRPVKAEKPLFGPRADYSEHQRDPKVFYVEEKGKYYIFIGAQTLDKKGCVQVYSSPYLLEGWQFEGQLKVPGYEDFGGMWECPCIRRLGDRDVLIFSPQYVKLPGRGESTNHNVYMTGHMDYDSLTFTPDADYRYLDYGFDFYAAQLASNTKDPDSAVLISWIGLPDNHYPTEEEDWEGSMTLPRELRIRGGRLFQTPVSGIEALRREEVFHTESAADGTQTVPGGAALSGGPADPVMLPEACEVLVRPAPGDFSLRLFAGKDGTGGFVIDYNSKTGVCTVDRRGMKKRFNTGVFEVLEMPLDTAPTELRIFIDRSSVEIFVNGGEETFTSHVYPENTEHGLCVTEGSAVRVWALETTVSDDFVV